MAVFVSLFVSGDSVRRFKANLTSLKTSSEFHLSVLSKSAPAVLITLNFKFDSLLAVKEKAFDDFSLT